MSEKSGHGIYSDLVTAAEHFVWKVEHGQARSVETYTQIKTALTMIEKARGDSKDS